MYTRKCKQLWVTFGDGYGIRNSKEKKKENRLTEDFYWH